MSEFFAEALWQRGTQDFLDRRYSRRHQLRFDGGLAIAGSSSPQVVPVPMSDPTALDPEEAFLSALSSCHLLWFLSIAAGSGFRVDRYFDAASGVIATDEAGKTMVSQVTLRPEVAFSGAKLPTRSQVEQMHERAHQSCFIANSVKTEVRCEPVHPRE
jgi:organic hydroperoxide reductase OsmC/OhrA